MSSECITIRVPSEARQGKLLPLGGTDADGTEYTVDNISFLRSGRRFLPVMGEFHFSRWERDGWREAILKMKAGGVQILATYVFWIYHEEIRGEWDFEGSRDLRSFLMLCREMKMPVWLRLGPWAHGECRNGGFPDWLTELAGNTGMELRSNDPAYLSLVRNYWEKLSEQCKGMMVKDGGPILGIQLENEYGHAGGTSDPVQGKAHLLTLKRMAQELGFEVPYYTATGWGGAHVAELEMLPVLGGYVDAPWDRSLEELPASEDFLFLPYHDDTNIASDAGGENRSPGFHAQDNPYLTAELGAGLQVTGHRRTYPWPEDIEALAVCMLGSGAGLLGYYMYHGGTHPDGKTGSLEEVPGAYGYNRLPKKSYDFQTCIRESGEIGESFGRLKKLHLMLEDFGGSLAGSMTLLPEQTLSSPEDLKTLRLALRWDPVTGEGFLFLNAHQRKRRMQDHMDFSVRMRREGCPESIIDHLFIQSGKCGIVPFHIAVGDVYLEKTNAYVLCRLKDHIVLYTEAGMEEKIYYVWSDQADHSDRVILLTRQEADRVFRYEDALYITQRTDSVLLNTADLPDADRKGNALAEESGIKSLKLITKDPSEKILVIRSDSAEEERRKEGHKEDSREASQAAAADGLDGQGSKGQIWSQINAVQWTLKNTASADMEGKSRIPLYAEYQLTIQYPTEDVPDLHEIYLEVDYLGDRAELYEETRLLADWFTTGEKWHIALRRLGFPKVLTIRVYDSRNLISPEFGDHVYYDLPVQAGCEIRKLRLVPEFSLSLQDQIRSRSR